VDYRVNPPVTNEALNALFTASWPNYRPGDFTPVLSRSLAYVCAYQEERLVGFVNLAWDGGIHAFLLDTTVHPDVRRQGIGIRLVSEAVAAAQRHGIEWVHVDYEPHLRTFYERCGFQPTEAGLIRVEREVKY
jgi:GNAT superfamily N-acetyltransferase